MAVGHLPLSMNFYLTIYLEYIEKLSLEILLVLVSNKEMSQQENEMYNLTCIYIYYDRVIWRN